MPPSRSCSAGRPWFLCLIIMWPWMIRWSVDCSYHLEPWWVCSMQSIDMTYLTYCFYDTGKSARSSSLVTLLLHLAWSLASWFASSTVRPKIVLPSLTLSNQRFFGLPTGLFPCTLPYSMMFGDAVWRHTDHMPKVRELSWAYVVDDIPADLDISSYVDISPSVPSTDSRY